MEVQVLEPGMKDYNGTPVFYGDPPAAVIFTDKGDNDYPGDPLPDSGYIRLVELWEPVPNSFTLEFRSVRLDAAPEYYALSYAWGTKFREVPSLGLRITDNLFSALSNLAEEKPRLWWIDALCIDQQNVKEKNEQVKLMHEIYGKAEQVCIWLGEPDTASLDLLRNMATRIEELFHVNAVFERGFLEQHGLPNMKDPVWSSLMQFIDRPYFKRVWVVQELVLGRKTGTTVACGRFRFDWLLIQAPIHWMRVTNLQTVLQSQASDPLRLSATMDDVLSLSLVLEDKERPFTLEYLLSISSELESTDPRDKIIALLGLVSPTDPSVTKIKVDYGQPVAEFFRDVTGTIITSNKSLKLLMMCADESLRKRSDIPSWVPDYSPASHTKYRLANFAIPEYEIDVGWTPGSNVLSFNGHLLDEIGLVSEHVPQRGSRPTPTIFSWFNMVAETFQVDPWELILSFEDSETVNGISEEFWRCLIADFVVASYPAPLEFRGYCAALLFSAFYKQQLGLENWTGWLFDLGKRVLACLKEQNILDSVKHDPQVILFDHLVTILESKRPEPEVSAHWKLPDAWARVEHDRLILGPPGDPNAFTLQMVGKSFQTRFFLTKADPVTQRRRMGRGPMSIRPGDRIAIVKGTNQVMILRHAGEYYRLVGECYVGGLMYNREDDCAWERISLI